jgi:hypothetical protein
MKSHYDKIKYLTESIGELQSRDNSRRKVLLTLLYWKVFDGIEIPEEILKQIMSRGTNPETIFRALRHVNEDIYDKEATNLEGD